MLETVQAAGRAAAGFGLRQRLRRSAPADRHRSARRPRRAAAACRPKMIEDLRVTLPGAVRSDDYQRRQPPSTRRCGRYAKVFRLGEKATSRDWPSYAAHGLHDRRHGQGEIIDAETFNEWRRRERRRRRRSLASSARWREPEVHTELEKGRRDAVNALDQETARFAINQEIDDLRAGFAELPQVLDHIEAGPDDVLQHVQLFLGQPEGESAARLDAMPPGHPFERYDVNVLVSNECQRSLTRGRGAQSDARQPSRPRRAHVLPRGAGNQFQNDQGRVPAPRQWRHDRHRRTQPLQRAVRLVGVEAGAGSPGDRDRGPRAYRRPDVDRDTGTKPHSAERQGRSCSAND